MKQLTQNLTGKLFGDKGYLGKKRAATLLKRGLMLMTKVRKNMKALPLTLTGRLLLNARNLAETIIGHIESRLRQLLERIPERGAAVVGIKAGLR